MLLQCGRDYHVSHVPCVYQNTSPAMYRGRRRKGRFHYHSHKTEVIHDDFKYCELLLVTSWSLLQQNLASSLYIAGGKGNSTFAHVFMTCWILHLCHYLRANPLTPWDLLIRSTSSSCVGACGEREPCEGYDPKLQQPLLSLGAKYRSACISSWFLLVYPVSVPDVGCCERFKPLGRW